MQQDEQGQDEQGQALGNKVVDVIVVGGGMVGAATALGLGQLGLKVALIESQRPEAYDPSQALDLRVSAINIASEQLLSRLGAMDQLKQWRHAPYLGLETWEMPECITRFHAKDLNVPHLGYFFENRLIQLSLWQQIEQLSQVKLYCPHKVKQISRCHDDGIAVTLDDGTELEAKLLVGADGANSQVRQWAGIGVTGWDYAQSAMLINIDTEASQQDITWQQFTPQGPRSLLPLPGNHASLVWYDDANRISQLMQLSHEQLAEQIRAHFPSRLAPEFSVSARGSFPLTRRHAQCYYQANLVILGDAAHTINPLAGQGVNIGFKDVDALLNTVASAIGNGKIWWQLDTLAKYQQARRGENSLMMTAMDGFYSAFSNDLLPLKLLRNGLLKVANLDSPIKRQVLKHALGL
ncbi:FAD-dependent oxidoreductase [Shewanella sp. SR44-3]|uniref:FAD-dependent oxidoreductase n=1 Tax=Shewanella sp. SR44-3 TaxID=2760936 RepID=UPI0015FDE6C3|nr:FAD-dependent oxidoreductase [Shewanella sp. SR44-3]MBB1268958.1 FAD-dependent monooxygenase [Shewanella sp. SR44-3]